MLPLSRLLPRGGPLGFSVPRNLLPDYIARVSFRTRAPISTACTLRYASSNSNHPPKLARPEKFNPPSHPSNLPRNKTAQDGYLGRSYNFPKDAPPPKETGYYPHTLPPPDTWQYWFLTNKSLHFYLSLTTLITLASIVTVTNFMKTSRFAGLVEWDWGHPVRSVGTFVDAYRMHMEERSRQAVEKRKRAVEEVEKRGEYRRAHGLEHAGKEGGFGGWSLKSSKQEEEVVVDDASPKAA